VRAFPSLGYDECRHKKKGHSRVGSGLFFKKSATCRILKEALRQVFIKNNDIHNTHLN